MYTPENYPEMQIDFAHGSWQTIKCQGCDEVSFREVWVTSEDINPRTGEPEEVVTLYPHRDKGTIDNKYFQGLPSKLRNIYRETIGAYNNNFMILCAAGVRAIVEGICSVKKVGGRNLQLKIDCLFTDGYLTRHHAEVLHEHRFMGNSAIHALDTPSKEELLIAINIIEHTIENIFEIKEKVDELKYLKDRRKKIESK